jgi:hypothetical protein
MTKKTVQPVAPEARKILAIKAGLNITKKDLAKLLGVKKIKRLDTQDDFIYWLETAIRHKAIVDDEVGEHYKFYEVDSLADSSKLTKEHERFGFALTFDEDLIDDFIDSAVIFDEIMQIRVEQHDCLTKHTELMNTLQGWGLDPKALAKFGAPMSKISHEYGQKLMEQSYDVLNDALVNDW